MDLRRLRQIPLLARIRARVCACVCVCACEEDLAGPPIVAANAEQADGGAEERLTHQLAGETVLLFRWSVIKDAFFPSSPF